MHLAGTRAGYAPGKVRVQDRGEHSGVGLPGGPKPGETVENDLVGLPRSA
jgi:hypothetical protein